MKKHANSLIKVGAILLVLVAFIFPLSRVRATGTITHEVTTADLSDNGYDNIGAPRQSAFTRFVFTTDAASVDVTGVSTMVNLTMYRHLGVRIDGVNMSPLILFTPNLVTTFTVPLGTAGTMRTVEITNGFEYYSGYAPVTGTYINSVTYPDDATFTIPTPTVGDRILFYGDSITAGAYSVNAETNSFVPLLRNIYHFRTMGEAWGNRVLYWDIWSPTAETAFVAQLASYTPSTIWFAIGTNDYGNYMWTAADFGTGYATLIDDLHTALPDTKIICQTPIVRGSEGPNYLGSSLNDYRDQIMTLCNARPWARAIDGSTFLTLSDLSPDMLHPTTAGFAKYANRIVPVLESPAVSVTGPTSGNVLNVSGVFTASLNGGATFIGDQSVTLTASDGTISVSTAGNTVTNNNSASVTVVPQNTATNFTFTYTPTTTGSKTITFTNAQNWINPTALSYTSVSDTTPPVISNIVSNTSGSNTTTLITWTTDENATHKVEYGLTSSYGSYKATNMPVSTSHSIVLRNLAAGTTYHYRVISTDASSNTATSSDYTFTTIAAPLGTQNGGHRTQPFEAEQ